MLRSSICKSLAYLGFLGLLAAPARADVDAAAAEAKIDAVTARHHVQFLAGDALEGRAAGSKGGRAAAAYIARRLASYGLEPLGTGKGDDAWFQDFERDGVRCRNVVAVRRGSDPRRRDEHIVLGAHYDHLGHGESGTPVPTLDELLGRKKGEIHPGADDNASGSAALLEVAEAFGALDPAPARSTVFVWFDGEERGLWGSQAYVRAPRLPLAKCVAMINMDEVGRSRGGRVQVIGANTGRGLVERIQAADRGIGLELEVEPFMVPNSDHYSFYNEGVPVAFFFTGLHPDYHRPGDTWEKVDYPDLARVARLAFRTARGLAASDERPALERAPAMPVAAELMEFAYGATGSELLLEAQAAGWGPIAGAYARGAEGGVEVIYVVPGSPAAAAGLAAGDRIVKAGGRAIAGELGRLRLLLLARRGDVAVEVSRDGARRAITIRAEKAQATKREPAEF